MNSKEFYYPVKWVFNRTYTFETRLRQFTGTTEKFLINGTRTKTNEDFYIPHIEPVIFEFPYGTDIEEIDLGGACIGDDTQLPSLSRFQKLKVFNAGRTSDESSYKNQFNGNLEKIGRGHALEYLDLYDNAISDNNAFGHLKYCRELKYLDLSYNNLYGSSFNGIENLTKLEHLDINSCKMLHTDATDVFRYMPNLKYLNAKYATIRLGLTDQFVNCTELEYLNLTANNMEGYITDLDKCTKLKYLLIDGCSFGGNLDNIKDLQELEEISLFADAHADDDERLSDVSALSNLSSLKKLTLGGQHEFGNVLDLENSLETIEYLDLTKCHLDEAPKDIEDMTSLTYLDLEYNSLDTDEVDRVLQALVDNGLENGFVNMRDGSNEEPSDDGKANKDTLEDRGWTVQTE